MFVAVFHKQHPLCFYRVNLPAYGEHTCSPHDWVVRGADAGIGHQIASGPS